MRTVRAYPALNENESVGVIVHNKVQKMDLDLVNQLNSIYKPIWDRADGIGRDLQEQGYTVAKGFYNNHSVKIDGRFVTEFFPIPVITVKGVGDIGVDLDYVWFEIVLPKEKALSLDYHSIAKEYKFEIYGSRDYLKDIYNEQIAISDIVPCIKDSLETDFCVQFYFEQSIAAIDIITIARILAV